MKVVINKILISVILFFITAFILSCEQDTNPANPNLTPNTTIANIPVDEDTLFALQTLHWDGEDDDGFIQHYEYRYSTFHMVRGDSFIQDWQMTNSTSLTIPFESSDDLNEQIFEVRAIDNSGAPDPSPAEKRFFTVKTVFPTTEILTPTDGQKAFSIDQTTDWWLGIELSFTGTDQDGDIVEFGWSVDGGDTTWTRDTTLFIAPDNFSEPLTGEHDILVTSRDNTNLIDPFGDSISVNLVRPTFEKEILVIDETIEANFPFGVFPPGTPNSAKDDSVDNFYTEVFGVTRSWDFSNRGIPPRDTLGKYKMVIWHADDRPAQVPHSLPNHINVVKDYMNVGGDFIMSGWRILKSFAWDENFPLNFPEGSFINDYLHIRAADESPLQGDFTHADGFRGFTDVQVDSTKLQEFPFFGKMAQINTVLQPAGFTEIIYLYGNDLDGLPEFRGHAVGLRYFGTSFDAVILGFPIFFMEKQGALILGDEVLKSLGYR